MKNSVLNILAILLVICSAYGQSRVKFVVKDLPSLTDQKVGIRGNLPPLDWSRSMELTKTEASYSIEIEFPDTEAELEFKFVLFSNDNKPVWESIDNRTLQLQRNGAGQISKNQWNREQIVDISALAKIESQALLEDYELIKTMVLEVHPGTYRYNTKEQIIEALDALKQKFSTALSYQEAYVAISKLTAQLQCDHTKAGFNNQGKVINSIIHYQADKLPFTFRWIGQEMVILQNASENDLLQRGGKVVSIDQVPVLDIRNEIVKYIGADGATDNNRIYKSQINGYDFRYNAFDIFYPLLFPIKDQSVELEIEQANQDETLIVEVSSTTREERAGILAERYKSFPRSRDEMWDFKLVSDSIAMLTLNSFGLRGWKAMTIDYKAFLAEAFDQVEKSDIPYLIIDIRENNGGNDEMAEELFSYIAEKSYVFDREGRTRYLDFPESLKRFIRTWGDNPWYYHLEPDNKSPENGYFIFKDIYTQKPKKSNKKVYKGRSFLLTSSANTSLAFYTAYRFKYQNIGTLVGQETGGNLNDINGGQILFLTLPNSGIEIDFPVMGGFSRTNQPNSGVVPYIEVDYTLKDLIDEVDPEVEEVMNLIDK